ncbi:MAG: hypothetical protein WC708_06510 [Lentisphaeria bacterium]
MKRITWMGSTMAILALVAAQARAEDAAAKAAEPAKAAAVEQAKTTDATDQAKQKKQWKKQTLCPVNGDPIDKDVSTTYKRVRVYFCCQDCVAKFKADPDTYMEKMKKDGIRCERLHNKGGKMEHPGRAKTAEETPKAAE